MTQARHRHMHDDAANRNQYPALSGPRGQPTDLFGSDSEAPLVFPPRGKGMFFSFRPRKEAGSSQPALGGDTADEFEISPHCTCAHTHSSDESPDEHSDHGGGFTSGSISSNTSSSGDQHGPDKKPERSDCQPLNAQRDLGHLQRDWRTTQPPPASLLGPSISAPSVRYLGSRTLARNLDVDLPAPQSCRFWITGLPRTCSVGDLLGSPGLRGVAGPVYAAHINPPTGRFRKSAASLTFFRVEDARRFFARYGSSDDNEESRGSSEDGEDGFVGKEANMGASSGRGGKEPLTVNGHTASVFRHRIRAAPVPVAGQSRVLRLRGPAAVVHPQRLDALFRHELGIQFFDTEYVVHRSWQGAVGLNLDDATAEVEWAFGSFRAQAHRAYVGIQGLKGKGRRKGKGAGEGAALRSLFENVEVEYLPDPCASAEVVES